MQNNNQENSEGRDEILVARTVTCGRRVLLSGGICKAEAKRKIEATLHCQVIWLDAEKGDQFSIFEQAAKRCDILISVIRLSSHDYTRGLSKVSRQMGIPLVRLTGGYNPAQIAHAICTQLLHA